MADQPPQMIYFEAENLCYVTVGHPAGKQPVRRGADFFKGVRRVLIRTALVIRGVCVMIELDPRRCRSRCPWCQPGRGALSCHQAAASSGGVRFGAIVNPSTLLDCFDSHAL